MKPTRYYCTYFDRNYLAKGLSLISSLQMHSRNDFKIYVVCMDELTRILVDDLGLKEVVTIPFHLIEQNDERLLTARGNRSVVEYLWTTTPTIIMRVLEMFPEVDLLTYLDADLFFCSSPEPIFNELGSKSVLIHGHNFSANHKHQEDRGLYNVGLLCFKRNAEAVEVLIDWRDKCLDWCYARIEDGKFGDQKYLDEWTTKYPCVLVTKNIGVGVAPWNDDQYKFTRRAGVCYVDEVPVVIYHFHSFTVINPLVYVPTAEAAYTPSDDLFETCVLDYAKEMERNIGKIQKKFPDYFYGILKNNFPLTPEHKFIARKIIADNLKVLNLTQRPRELDYDWDLYC